jgi:pyruvate,orthophosphate dikinase
VVPEVATLVGWAREAGVDVGDTDTAPSPTAPSQASGAVDGDRVVRAISIKGFVTAEGVADAVVATPVGVQPVLDGLVADGLVESTSGAYRLTAAGHERADALVAQERDAWGVEAATAGLDAFLDIDHRVKDVVTAWQMREGGVNDHTDAGYDAGVLERLATLHADATAWIAPLEPTLPRLGDYRARLIRALEAAQSGDGRYVASPRVDSYHGIWFELHEDLIQLAGRTREEETAAGRA